MSPPQRELTAVEQRVVSCEQLRVYQHVRGCERLNSVNERFVEVSVVECGRLRRFIELPTAINTGKSRSGPHAESI
jgi:hypothetical protein